MSPSFQFSRMRSAAKGLGKKNSVCRQVRIARRLDPFARVLLAIGPRHARQHAHHRLVPDGAGQLGGILEPRGAQEQPLGEELPAEGDHLDVEVRVVGAEHLHADLVELAVAPALGLLVAEVGARVPHLPWRGGTVLDERPAHAGGLFGAQGHVTLALVDEVVHLLGHHVGGIADPGEHPDVFEQRRGDLAVSRLAGVSREEVREPPAPPRFGRQDVAHPGRGLELRHGPRGYRPHWALGRVRISRGGGPRPWGRWRPGRRSVADDRGLARARAGRGRETGRPR